MEGRGDGASQAEAWLQDREEDVEDGRSVGKGEGFHLKASVFSMKQEARSSVERCRVGGICMPPSSCLRLSPHPFMLTGDKGTGATAECERT